MLWPLQNSLSPRMDGKIVYAIGVSGLGIKPACHAPAVQFSRQVGHSSSKATTDQCILGRCCVRVSEGLIATKTKWIATSKYNHPDRTGFHESAIFTLVYKNYRIQWATQSLNTTWSRSPLRRPPRTSADKYLFTPAPS